MSRVVVASQTTIKRRAVEMALARTKGAHRYAACEVVGVKAPSGISECPHGFDETLLGATNRLAAAKAAASDASLYVSIESGLVQLGGIPASSAASLWYDFAWVLVEDPIIGRSAQTVSAMVRFPSAECDAGLAAGTFPTEDPARVISARLQKESSGSKAAAFERADESLQDPHEALTAGYARREDILADAVYICLGQLKYGHDVVQSTL